jgi:WD40 repeat protein
MDKQPGSRKQGVVKIYNLTELSRNKEVECHESPLQCLEISRDGKRLATVSQTGTLSRVWDTTS